MKILLVIAAYLLGSIPTGYLLVRGRGRRDVRELGSGSTGATNVLRVQGWKAALPVAVVDVLKGFLPAFLALRWLGDPVFAALCGLLAVVGHCYPFSIGFRGGKGVATSLGAYAAIAFVPCLASVGLFLVVTAATRFVSLGSMLASIAFPILVLATGGSGGVAAVSLAIAVLIVLRHKDNIARLLAGTERKLGRSER
jgi:glycerol-3-phosphate acyltransferase PlsY